MKAAFSAEAIGLGNDAELAMLYAVAQAASPSAAPLLRPKGCRPWVAEITGTDPRYGLARRFLPHKTDYRGSNSKATRGVMFWWTLEPGRLYQARYRVSWQKWEERFLTVTDDGGIRDLTAEEAARWASGISAPTS